MQRVVWFEPVMDRKGNVNKRYLPEGSSGGGTEGVVKFEPTSPIQAANLFFNWTWLTEGPSLPLGVQYTSANMFYNCPNLVSIPKYDLFNVSNLSGMFAFCSALQEVPKLDTSQASDFSMFAVGCASLTTLPALDFTYADTFSNFAASCTNLVSHPPIVAPNAYSFDNMFMECLSLVSSSGISVSEAASLEGMYRDCTSLKSVELTSAHTISPTASYYTRPVDMFQGCSALESIVVEDARRWLPKESLTTGYLPGSGSYLTSLTSIIMNNYRGGLDLSNTKLSAEALNAFFSSLGEADLTVGGDYAESFDFTGTQTIRITNTPGAATCDRSIATAKGFTVVG